MTRLKFLMTLVCLVGFAAGLAACSGAQPQAPASGAQGQATSPAQGGQPDAAQQTADAGNTLATQSRLTVQAMQTAAFYTPTPPPPPPTATAQAVVIKPSSTPMPSATPINLAQTPTRDATAIACDQAALVKDVTIPDGFYVGMGSTFTKTWRIRNSGECTWLGSYYELVFNSGEQMGGPDAQKLKVNVLPDGEVEISLALKAPETAGRYQSYWMLRNAGGVTFGLGDQAKPLHIDIQVGGNSPWRYDFLGFYCQAYWKGDNEVLPCNGKDGDPKGFVIVYNEADLEDGTTVVDYTLLTQPPGNPEGTISGMFTEFTVRNGDHFQALLSCEYEYTKCNVTYLLNYQIGDEGPLQNYATWTKKYDGKVLKVDVDLQALAKKTVRFFLTVRSNGGLGDNRALWVRPKIVWTQPAATAVPPTATPTP